MLQTTHNSEFTQTMDLFKEIEDLGDLFFLEKNTKLNCTEGGYEDLQSKYSSLHENYAKEMENSKKVETCLIKCLKFYSKLCKKYEMQQKIISNFEESIKEKVRSLEEAQKNEERLKGVIEVYRTERLIYAGQTSKQLREEKEILLDICCKLISESVRSNNTSTMSKLILRKFKNDLSDKNIILLKDKSINLKDELYFDKDFKTELKNEKMEFKLEDKYSSEMTKVEMKDPEEDIKNNQLDLNSFNTTSQEGSCLDSYCTDGTPFAESKRKETDMECSQPLLEEFPLSLQPCPDNEKQHQEVFHESVVPKGTDECDMGQNGSEMAKPISDLKNSGLDSRTENVSEHSDAFEAPAISLGSLCEPLETPAKCSSSIFDISDICPKNSDSRTENAGENVDEFHSHILIGGDNGVEDLSFVNNPNGENVNVKNFDEDSTLPDELSKIFKEMASIRLLSPIRESTVSSRACAVVPNKNENGNPPKRNSNAEENPRKYKRFKSEVEKPSDCLLDSILSAMSVQNEEFKSKTFHKMDSGGETGENAEGSSSEASRPGPRTCGIRKRIESCTSRENSAVVCRTPGRKTDSEQGVEKLVAGEIKNFVSCPISCKEDADKNVKQCVSALANKPEDVIARCIVAMVLENADEAVEIFERPAPPLTKTQHRLIVLLSVFRTLEWDSEKISTKILAIIHEKLLPDNFFWPDDSVEAATRFYTALCKARNDPKTLWRFCLSAMTDMRQRSPLLVFTVLKTWPDVLYDSSIIKGNVIAVTVVNIFLDMPKTEGLRNSNQVRKLVALKHLLNNFYQFKMEETLEGFAKKVLEGIRREEAGAEKSLVLLSKCKDPRWTVEIVVPGLMSSLVDWSEGRMEDSVAKAILSVIKQISPIFTEENSVWEKGKELALCLIGILTSRKKSHDCEVNIMEALLQLKKYPAVRKTICEWIPKNPISDCLRNEIINASAEKILRELKLNRKKSPKKFPNKPKQWKKSYGKKRKGKKKKTEETFQVQPRPHH